MAETEQMQQDKVAMPPAAVDGLMPGPNAGDYGDASNAEASNPGDAILDGENTTESVNANETGEAGNASASAASAPDVRIGLFTIKDVKNVCRARTLRLQKDDVIVGIDGRLLDLDLESFLDTLFECDTEVGVMLTIYRKGIIFNVIARGMLGCVMEYTKPDMIEEATKAFKEANVGAPEEYHIFEVLRDIQRRCSIVDTEPSLLAVLFSPAWLIQNKLWEALIAVVLIYGTTLTVHWMLFVMAIVLLGLYFRRAQITLKRSFGLFRDRQMWMVIAARDMLEVQQTCRKFDPKCTFNPDLVGPPEMEEARPKKRRRRSAGAAPSAA